MQVLRRGKSSTHLRNWIIDVQCSHGHSTTWPWSLVTGQRSASAVTVNTVVEFTYCVHQTMMT